MKAEAFWDMLRRDGSYRTDENDRGAWLNRVLGRLDPWYYLRISATVFRGFASALVGRFDRACWSHRAFGILRAAEASGATVTIRGMQSVLGSPGPKVYAANHMSMLETMVLPGGLILPFEDVVTVLKDSLVKYPVFGSIVRQIDPIVVGRKNARHDLKRVLEQGRERLASGRSVVLFPQATRDVVFRPAKFNSLATKLAERAGVPLVPVAVRTDFQSPGHVVKDFGRVHRDLPVHFEFGAPRRVDGDAKQVHRDVVAFITERLRNWGAQIAED